MLERIRIASTTELREATESISSIKAYLRTLRESSESESAAAFVINRAYEKIVRDEFDIRYELAMRESFGCAECRGKWCEDYET